MDGTSDRQRRHQNPERVDRAASDRQNTEDSIVNDARIRASPTSMSFAALQTAGARQAYKGQNHDHENTCQNDRFCIFERRITFTAAIVHIGGSGSAIVVTRCDAAPGIPGRPVSLADRIMRVGTAARDRAQRGMSERPTRRHNRPTPMPRFWPL
jgi:hypothetical protein